MANKYISWDTGNDSTGDGSLGTPWKTFTKALGATGIGDGDVLYAAPGIYRETVSVAMTSPTAETKVLGDPWNAQGFSGVSPGPVILTPFTTDDESVCASGSVVTIVSKNYLTFENLYVYVGFYNVGSNGFDITTSHDITFRSCIFTGVASSTGGVLEAIEFLTSPDIASNLLIEKCLFARTNIDIRIDDSASADYDAQITLRNCIFNGVYMAVYITGNSGSFYGGGVDAVGCLIIGYYGFYIGNANLSTTYPCTVTDCVVDGNSAIYAAAANICTEDYNLLLGNTPRTNVSAGSNSEVCNTSDARSYVPALMMREMWGIYPNLGYYSPLPHSGTMNFAATTGLSVDMLNRPKPSGGGPIYSTASGCIGALECHEYGVRDTSTKDAGDASIKLTGPGDHELVIPVAAESTTISIKARYASASYGGTNYPQAILIDRESFANITSDTETKTATVSASDAWETLTFTAFTPSRKGVVRLRLVNRSSAGAGVCWFDTVTVT